MPHSLSSLKSLLVVAIAALYSFAVHADVPQAEYDRVQAVMQEMATERLKADIADVKGALPVNVDEITVWREVALRDDLEVVFSYDLDLEGAVPKSARPAFVATMIEAVGNNLCNMHDVRLNLAAGARYVYVYDMLDGGQEKGTITRETCEGL